MTFIGKLGRGNGLVEVSVLIGGCLGLRTGMSQVGENLTRICDRGLFV